jgi:HD superfamily phosphodiesterase
MDNIIKSASEYVTKLLIEKLPIDYTYHNLNHTREVFDFVTEISNNSNLPSEELEMVQVAAWFHDTGFILGYREHENKSVEIAREFLKNMHYADKKIDSIKEIIKATKKGKSPETLPEKIIRDADILHISKEDFYPRSLTLKAEWENIDDIRYTEAEWIQSSLDFINRTFFYTEYAILNYEAGRQKNIIKLNELIKELQS